MSVVSIERLAPPPDFRYVGFSPAPRGELRLAGSVLSGTATAGLVLAAHGGAIAAAVFGVVVSAAAALGMRMRSGPSRAWGQRGTRLGFTPWGILLEPEDETEEDDARVLRWAAVERVSLTTVYGRDQGTPSTLFSTVHVETKSERWTGRSHGAAPLDSVLVHMEAYAREQSHAVALDLEGTRAGEGPFEPDFEPLLSSALEAIESAPSSHRLGLPPSGYRRASARVASNVTLDVLRECLRDTRAKPIDPRAFACVLAAELGAKELASDLVKLAQSPHPLLAATARASAMKLGMPIAKTGSLEEVAPFLLPADVASLEVWVAHPFRADDSVASTAG